MIFIVCLLAGNDSVLGTLLYDLKHVYKSDASEHSAVYYKEGTLLRALKTGALGQPRGVGCGGTGIQDWGTHVHPWLIHGRNHHNIVK